MKISACIFDLDGVLVDTARYHFLSWKRLTDILGIDFTIEDNERLKGVSRMASLEIILSIGKMKLPETKKTEYAELKNKWYVEYLEKMDSSEILPGSIEFVSEIRKAGIKTAVGSASRNTPMILRQTGLEKYFDAVADGNNVHSAKPDPEVFLTAASLMNVAPGECIVFEDAIAGIKAARAAGMICIGVGSPAILHEAYFVIPGLGSMNLEKLREIEKQG